MNSGEYLLQQIINAVSIGSLYALMAIGLSMVFGILRLINFAHGDLIMVGSYTTLLLLLGGLPFVWASAAGIAASTLAGLLMERIAYRPIRGAPDVAMLLTSFAVTIFLENLAIILFKATSRAFPVPLILNTVVSLGNLQIASLNIISILFTVVLLVLLTFLSPKQKLAYPCAQHPRFGRGAPHGDRRQSSHSRGFRDRLIHGGSRGNPMEYKSRKDRPAHGIQPCAQGFRRLGHRWAGKHTERRARWLCAGRAGNSTAGAFTVGHRAIPRRPRISDTYSAAAFQA